MNKYLEKIKKNIDKINEKNLKIRLKIIRFWAKKALKSIERS